MGEAQTLAFCLAKLIHIGDHIFLFFFSFPPCLAKLLIKGKKLIWLVRLWEHMKEKRLGKGEYGRHSPGCKCT